MNDTDANDTGTDTSQALARRLRAETGGEVRFDAASRGRYATDASIYQIMPVGVFVPRDEADIERALAIARDLKVPVLPRGAGTSQCGQTTGAALVVDTTKHFNRILAVDAGARTATVEPGLVLDALNARLKPLGLWFPVDVSTSAQATLGGMAGNNSCGSRSIRYGNMVHNVLGASAWLSDGERVDFGPVASLGARATRIAEFVRGLAERHRADIDANWPTVLRRVAGYNLDIFANRNERPYTADGSVNLSHLLIGSEGTLGFTRTLTLALAPLPKAKVLGVVNFPSFRAAMAAAQHIVRLEPTAVELVDRTMIDLALANPAFRPTIAAALIGEPAAVLLVEFAGDDKPALRPMLDRLDELIADLGLPDAVVKMADDTAQKNLWEVRKAGLNIMMSLKGDGKPVSFIEDCAVPLEHLADYTDALTEVFARHGTRGTWYAHASVGTLHVRPILDMRVAGPGGGAAKMRAIAEEAAVLVRRYRGAYSGEHGDGLCRGEWIEWQFGPAITDAFRAIKRELDPIGLFNPRRIVDPPRMDDASLFRFASDAAPKPYRRITLTPVLDWSAWNVDADPVTERTSAPGTGGDSTGGFAKAIEMCNNNGHCRKFDAGTMCPSYRVTRDEQHLTRGRANTLRLAVSGQLGADALTSDALYETMDLCVGCKGCRRECPTGVDMAKMKVEFLAHYKARHGFTLRDRLVAHLPDYARLASRVPWLANLRDTLPGMAALGERLLGLSAARSLPRFRADTFWQARAGLGLASRDELLAAAAAGDKVVALFVDTFNAYLDSENALAAVKVLEAAGYRVHAIARGDEGHCCGRTFLATGMVEKAREKARALVDALAPIADAGIPIVGLEPSCLLSLRDEFLVLGLGASAPQIAAHARLFEEFVAAEAAAGRFSLTLAAVDRPILVHGHCHQKAFDAVAPILDVLKLIPGAKPELIESACCGMAGSFGYEASHRQVSMAMAEASLLPAVRAKPDAIVVADGTSCRHQIADGAQRDAVHVAALLASLLPA
ncbi:MAG: FAD-binding and (Fe-S)-binding domain-containing protein [Lautropia sp.]